MTYRIPFQQLKSSRAGGAICRWVLATQQYANSIKPKMTLYKAQVQKVAQLREEAEASSALEEKDDDQTRRQQQQVRASQPMYT